MKTQWTRFVHFAVDIRYRCPNGHSNTVSRRYGMVLNTKVLDVLVMSDVIVCQTCEAFTFPLASDPPIQYEARVTGTYRCDGIGG